MSRMPTDVDAPPDERDSVLIRAKRLDSEEVVETVAEVAAARSETSVRDRLGRVVRATYPEAEFRSYADGAATFLAPKLLIVAIHRTGDVGADPGQDDDSQQQLFAA